MTGNFGGVLLDAAVGLCWSPTNGVRSLAAPTLALLRSLAAKLPAASADKQARWADFVLASKKPYCGDGKLFRVSAR